MQKINVIIRKLYITVIDNDGIKLRQPPLDFSEPKIFKDSTNSYCYDVNTHDVT